MGMMQAIPLISLFLSGFGALLLQEVWVRAGILIFGSTTVAVTVVVSTFMGGLALGYGLISRSVEKLRRPLAVYSVVEIVTGLLSAGVSFFLCSGPTAWAAPPILVIGAVLVPATLMGLTVPLVVAGLESGGEAWVFKSVSLAYGINTLGGAVGALLGAFWIMPGVGVSGSAWIGTLLLAVAGVATGVVAPKLSSGRSERGCLPGRAEVEKPGGGIVYAIAFVGGACGLSLEIVWTRVLGLVFGPSVYAIGIVLFVNLAGIGLGSLLFPWISGRVSKVQAVAGSLLLGAAAIAFGTSMVGVLPYLFLFLAEEFQPRPEMLAWVEVLLSCLVILPATLIQGLLLPLLVAWHSGASAARSTGRVFSANTFGSILGAVLTGLWLIPRFGFLVSLILFFALYLLLSLQIFGWRKNVWLTAGCLVFLVLFPWRASRFWDRNVLASGVYKYAVGKALAGHPEPGIVIGELLYYREGISSTVAVIDTADDIALSIDGKVDATARGDRSTQILLGALPLSLSAKAEKTLVIGFASGMTAGISSLFPSNRVTAVEIEPAVYKASEFFRDVNFGPLLPPKHEMLVEDARHYLLRTDRAFDVITSEPSNPWMSGVAPLFTREFFELAKARLSPGGVMCQWLPIYGMSHDLVASVLKTFSDVFPHVLVFESIEDYDLLMIGAGSAPRLDPGRIESRWRDPALKKELARIRIFSGLDLVGRFAMGKKGIRRFAGNVPLNTDTNGLLEFGAPKSLYLRTAKENGALLSQASAGFEGYLEKGGLTREDLLKLKAKMEQRGEIHLAEALE